LARKILLADDSVTAQNMGRKILADAGYDVITVNNGSAALKRIAETSPDLIILDVYMPGYSGLEVCQKLKEAAETADIPVLLSVGKLEPFKPQEARRVRADAHIVKPFEASQLLTAIARLEDAMVPQQHKSRFATSGAASDESFGSQEESRILGRGAKSSGLRRKEASPADAGNVSGQAAAFRDFRKSKLKSSASAGAADSTEEMAPEPSQEPGPLAKLPRDITPEELNALSEVAAQLTGAVPAESSSASSQGSTSSPSFASSEETSPETADSHAESAPAAAAAAATSIPFATVTSREPAAVAVPEAGAPEADHSASAELAESSTPALASDAPQNVVEIPVAQLEPAAETARGDQTSEVNSQPVTSQAVESPQDSEFQAPEAVSAASFADEPAPIDQQEEPMFASAVAEVTTPAQPESYAAPEVLAQENAEAKTEESSPHQSSSLHSSSLDSSSLDSSFAQTAMAESTSESLSSESTAAEFCAIEASITDPITTERPSAAAQATQETTADAPMPSEAELAEALRLLMPATVASESASAESTSAESMPEPEKVSVTAQASADDSVEAAAATRWVAEALALTPEEAAMSLEAEMFQAFAASAEKIESLPAENSMLAIQSAVESRLAEATAVHELDPAEAAPKAMAAAAPAGQSADSADQNDIASIVEKVMADLRPRIVEEIARKLASKS
jgi:CheY-like chemotaxis protein